MNAQVAAQAIAGATRYEAERRRPTDERGCDFIHRSIATDGHDQIVTSIEGVAGERRRVTGALGEVDHGAVMRGELLDGRQDANGAAGPKIYDEARFQRSDGMESRSRRQC
jgi:hypothetical protein